MAEETVVNNEAGYGYASDDVKISPFNFGGNFGNCFLTKIEWIPNGGANGAEQEALDIIFKINDVDKSYRMFPVTQGFDKNNQPVKDPNSKEFKDALQDWNAKMTHIMHCFVSDDVLKAALAKRIKSLKEYAAVIKALLPKDFDKKPLDIFLQYQWQPSANKSRTYLEIPKKMSYGKWLCPAMAGNWKEMKAENIDENTRKALWYVNEEGQEHIFVKNGWFMSGKFSHQQKEDTEEEAENNASKATSEQAAITTSGDAPASKEPSAW
jgi:hypothetical protein